MKTKIEFTEKIKDTSLFKYALVLIPLAIYFITKNILFVLIAVGLLIFIRIRSGKIKVKDGDEIYVFGLPGSGKTMLLVKIALDNKNRRILVNKELEHIKIKKAVISKKDMAKYSFGTAKNPTMILYDEASLDGFDNRNFKDNFKGKEGEEILECFKKSRHDHNAIIIANQGYNEVDFKIRSGLCKCAYWVKNKGYKSVAIKLSKDMAINKMSGEPQDMYRMPTLLERIIDPSCYVYINHKKYGKYYQTINYNRPYYFDYHSVDGVPYESKNP